MELFNVLAGVGVTLLFVYGQPFKPIRSMLSTNAITRELVSCSLCVGFWVGLGFALCHNEWRYATVIPISAWLYDAVHGRLVGEY